MNDQQRDAFIKATADLLRLSIDNAWLPRVQSHFEVISQLADVVTAFDLTDEVEQAPIFLATPDVAP